MHSQGRGIHLVAEGIESEEELAVAQEIGIHLVQGYLFGKPAMGLSPVRKTASGPKASAAR